MTSSEEHFEAALSEANVVNRESPRIEVEGAVTYHLFDNDKGEEVGWISFLNGERLGLTIRPNPAAPPARLAR